MSLYELFLSSFITLFVIADPLGTAAVFTGLTAGYDRHHIWVTATKAVLVAFGLLVFFALLGSPLLAKLDISIPAFRIAGGLLLFVTAFRMIFGQHEPEAIEKNRGAYIDQSDIAVFPLAIPLMSGPGCMTAVILLVQKTEASWQVVTILGAILAVHIISFVCLLGASSIQRIIGSSGTNILARVMGVILAAMSIQFISDGLRGMHFLAAS
jgi:multiple antibiotic resistance protein